jgi:uncharacterized protein involved in exopolysaccharide biosynthesis
MLYLKVLPAAFVLAVIYALSLPNYYSCTVKLAPELGSSVKAGGGLADIASSFGINLGGASSGADAINPTLYPDLMNSVDFKTSLFRMKVTREEDGKTFSYYDYLANEQKYPWWTSIIRSLFVKPDTAKTINPFRLTKNQTDIAKDIDKKVSCAVDKKTYVITIDVTDQDPLICATLADSVKTRLQKFITDYRTSKARVDLEYNKKILAEATARYEKARDKYSQYSDTHRGVSSTTAQTHLAELQAEMELHQQIFRQIVAQLQQADMKVQESTPAFTTLQSATVPVRKAGPARAKMCLIFLFLAFLATTVYIFYKEGDLKSLFGL